MLRPGLELLLEAGWEICIHAFMRFIFLSKDQEDEFFGQLSHILNTFYDTLIILKKLA